MAKSKPSYPPMEIATFNAAAALTLMGPNAINAARHVLVDVMSNEEAGLKAGYPINTAKSAASRAAKRISLASNVCPCCKRPFK